MMKIAFIGGRDIYKLGGIETYMFNLCTKLVQCGHEPIVYCEGNCNKIKYVNGFKVIYWKSPKSIYICKIWLGLKSTLHALFVEDGVKIFHYNAWPPSLWNWIPRLMGRKAILMGRTTSGSPAMKAAMTTAVCEKIMRTSKSSCSGAPSGPSMPSSKSSR